MQDGGKPNNLIAVKCECGFIMGYAETPQTSNIICHYCAIEMTYFRYIFAQEAERIPDYGITEWDKFCEDLHTWSGAFYDAQHREKRLHEMQSFINQVRFNPNILEEEEK